MTAAWKAESEQEGCTGEGICVRSIQAEGKDDIARLRKQIVQLHVAVQKPQNTRIGNPWQLSSEKDGNGKKGKTKSQGKSQANGERSDHMGIKCFWCEWWGHLAHECPSTPLNGKWGEVAGTSDLPPRNATRWRGARDIGKYWQTGNRIWESQHWALSASTGTCKWNKGCSRGSGDNSPDGYWVPNFCPHWGILCRKGVEDPSTEESNERSVASQGKGGISIQYKGYLEANSTIMGLPCYNEDVLFW